MHVREAYAAGLDPGRIAGVRTHTSASAGDANGHGGTVAKVCIVGASELGDDRWALVGDAEEDEAEVHDGGAAHVIADVSDRVPQQPLDRCIVVSASVRQAHRKHAPKP